jgi:tetratricopeptide (TPR) repeat protein/transglutaminase-like putative cysteine protease
MISHHARVVRLLALSLIALVFSGAVHAAEGWPVKRGPSREPAPYKYDPAEWKKLPREFLEDFPACTLYNGLTYLVEADGTIEKISHEVTRFTGRKGVERLGEYRNITYDPAYETLTLNEARVFKADGKVVAIDPRHVHLRDVGTDYQVYEHEKQLIISFPSLEVGDTIDVKWTTRGRNPEHQGHFFTRYTFGDERFPCGADELRVRLPKDRVLKHAVTGGKIEPVIKEEGEFRTFHWRGETLPPLPQDENLPSKEELRAAVYCSTFTTWAEVGEWKKKLRKDCWTCTPEIKTVVAEATKGLDKPLDRARALTYWVRRHVRYISAGEKHDFTPHQPAAVLANRFGDCKDTSQLLAVMLKEAGVDVALATLGTLDDGQILESVPSPWGTHAILLLTIDGKQHWVDTTVSLAAWNYLPRDDRDRLCYVVNGKDLTMVRTPGFTAEQNRTVNRTKIVVSADGSSRCERHTEGFGAAAHLGRTEWVEVPPGERRRGLAAELQNAQSKAHLLGFTIDEKKLKDFDQPVSSEVVFEVPAHFNGENNLEGSITDSRVWGRLLSVNLDYDRKVPLDLGTPFESLHTYTIELPYVLRFEDTPRSKSVKSKWGTFDLKVKTDPAAPRKLTLEFHTRMNETRVAPADFDAWRKFHEDVFKAYRVWLTLETKLNPADAPALDKYLATNPGDTISASHLVEHYLAKKEAKEARRVLKEAVRHRPDDVRLRKLQVNAAEGPQEVEAAYAELMRLEPNKALHPLELAEYRIDRKDYAGARKMLELAEPKAKAAPIDPPLNNREALLREVHLKMARCWYEEKKPAEALAELKKAGDTNDDPPTDPSILILKARIHEQLKQPKDALSCYQSMLKRAAGHSDAGEAVTALIRLEKVANREAQALPYVRAYSAAVRDDLNGLVRAASCYLELNRLDDALELAERARDIDFHPDAQRVLGLVQVHRGEYQKALFHLERATPGAEVMDATIQANLGLGRLSAALKQTDNIEAVKPLTPALRRTYAALVSLTQRQVDLQKSLPRPTKVKASEWNAAIEHAVCAEHALSLGRSADQVQAILNGAFANGIEVGPALALRSQLALDRGRLAKASTDAERAVMLCPKESRGYYVRGRARLERGQEGALADLSRAAALSGRKDAAMLHWLATALDKAGARAEALAAQREAATLNPQSAEIREQLKELEKERE